MGLFEMLKGLVGSRKVSFDAISAKPAMPAAPIPVPEFLPPAPAKPKPEPIEITKEYQKVIDLLEGGSKMVLALGQAGTGKSTLVNHLRGTFKGNVAVVAPTGVAALNIKGSTINSFFRFPPRIVMDDDIKKVFDRELYSRLDLLVVDEISMVRADMLDAMDRFLRVNGRDKDLPFGGTRLLMVGDLFQLPPVVKKQDVPVLKGMGYRGSPFFFAKAFRGNDPDHVELTEIFRQKDKMFTDILGMVRVAERLDLAVSIINSACRLSKAGRGDAVILTCTNAAADKINAEEMARIQEPSRVFAGEIQGKFLSKDDKLPAPINLELKPGAQVMFVKNDGQRRWVNGTLGQVVSCGGDCVRVKLLTDHPGEVHDVHPALWESFAYKYDHDRDRIVPVVIGQYQQLPLVLAWAVTIHKSQGKTMERVMVDFGSGTFATGQAYVALSRCRTMAGIGLSRPIRKDDIKCDPRIREFYLNLCKIAQ